MAPDWPMLFHAFEKARKADTDAIADLAIENFVEMRDRVADPRFLFRKKVELELEKKYPGRFVPKYAMVTFHRTPYSVAAAAGSDSGPHAGRALRFGAAAGGHRLGKGRGAGAAGADSAARSCRWRAITFDTSASFAAEMDARDPLAHFREQFHIPPAPDGSPSVYLCGHSLGLQPKRVREYIEQELQDWATLGVEAHFHGRHPWMPYHRLLTDNMAAVRWREARRSRR